MFLTNILSKIKILITQFYDDRILINDEKFYETLIVDTVAKGSMLNLPGIEYSNKIFGFSSSEVMYYAFFKDSYLSYMWLYYASSIIILQF